VEQVQQDRTSLKRNFDEITVRKNLLTILNTLSLKNSRHKRSFVLDNETTKAVELISQYANNEIEFEKTKNFSLNKGIWICGNFGSGKTQLLIAYKELKKLMNVNVGFQTCADMNMKFLKKDEFNNSIARFDGIKTFMNKFDTVERIFDDLGEEETNIMDFGNKVCIMAHILSERYKGLNNGVKTHITTNLSMEQISNTYGGRIESRISEMFNVITLGSKADSTDYRKVTK